MPAERKKFKGTVVRRDPAGRFVVVKFSRSINSLQSGLAVVTHVGLVDQLSVGAKVGGFAFFNGGQFASVDMDTLHSLES